jgi:type II secretory pathway component PulC
MEKKMSQISQSTSQASSQSTSNMNPVVTFFLGFFVGLILALIGAEKWATIVQKKAPINPEHIVLEPSQSEPPATTHIDPAAPVAETKTHEELPDHDMEITKSMRDRMITIDFLDLLQDADLHRYRHEGETKGVILAKIRTGSIYEKAGFKDGDIIEQINGIAVADIAKKPTKMKLDLPAADRLVFIVRRNEKMIKLQIRVAGGLN